MSLLGLFSIFYTAYQGIKDACEPTIPAANWANKELMDKDRKRGLSEKQIMQNVKNGRYIMSIQYAEPHRDPKDNKVIIENYQLYKEECRTLGAYEAGKCVKQGKYNLNASEMKIVELILEKDSINLFGHATGFTEERKTRLAEINKLLAASNWDFHNTEAVKHWQRAHDANVGRY